MGVGDSPTLKCSFKKKKFSKILGDSFFLGAIFLGRVVVCSPKIVRSYTEKENHIGLAVREILRYRQTNTDPGKYSELDHLFLF